MSEIMPEPKTILPDRNAVIAYITDTPTLDDCMDKWHAKSLWLCELIEKMQSETTRGFCYNSEVVNRACDELGIDMRRDCGTPLSVLVYNAQRYVHSDWLKANRYEPFTQELIDRAGTSGRKIETEGGQFANVKKIGDTWYAMPPRSRTKHYNPDPFICARIV